MPFTVNGIGTTYYGRQHARVRQGVCEACKTGTTLTSYDTARYFVIAFIPALPLGKQRVMDECGRCRRHRVMPLAKWTAFRAQAIEEAVAAAHDAPADAARVRHALETAIAVDDEDAFLNVAAIAEAEHARDAETLRALGAGYTYLNHPIDAEETYRALVKLDKDDAEAREQLAVTMMREGRPVDASPIVDRVFQDERVESLWLVQYLIEAFQALGNHEMAHSLLNRCERVFPDTAKDAHHKYLRQVSTKNSQAGTPVPSPSLPMGTRLRSPDDGPGRDSHVAGRVAAVVAMLLIPAVVAVGLLLSHHQAANRTVYVVNGTDAAYRVDVNGQTLALAPKQRRGLALAEGEVVVRVLDSALPVPEQRVTIETPLLTRLFGKHLFVLNPDRAAVLVWEETVYTAANQPVRDDPYEIHTGELLHAFEGIDHPFTEFPARITSSQSGAVYRERVEHVSDQTPNDNAFLILTHLGPEAAATYARNAARFEPASEDLFDIIGAWSDHDDLVAFVEPHLDDRPLRREWHRVYQDALAAREPERDLLSTYRAHVDEAPDDPDRVYLHARLLADLDAQEAGLLRAIDLGLETHRPEEWLITGMLSTGRFEEAVALMDRLGATEDRERAMLPPRRHSLVALGRIDEALQLDAKRLALAPEDAQVIADYMVLLMRSGRSGEARQLVADFMGALTAQEADAETLGAWSEYFESVALYQAGDEAAFGAAVADASIGWLRFRGAVCLGRLDAAYRILQEDEDAIADVDDYLVLAIAAHRAGEPDLARRSLAAAGDAWLETQPPQLAEVAAWLRGTETPAADAVRAVRHPEVRTKLLLLTAMGLEHPAERDACFALARELNFDTRYPYLLVEPILSAAARTAGESGR